MGEALALVSESRKNEQYYKIGGRRWDSLAWWLRPEYEDEWGIRTNLAADMADINGADEVDSSMSALVVGYKPQQQQ